MVLLPSDSPAAVHQLCASAQQVSAASCSCGCHNSTHGGIQSAVEILSCIVLDYTLVLAAEPLLL
jgi:hypothetical protein